MLNRSEYPPSVCAFYSGYKNCQLLPKMCQYLNKPPVRLHSFSFCTHLEGFMCCLLQASHTVPLELKELLENGVFFAAMKEYSDEDIYLIRCVQFIFLMCIDRCSLPHILKPQPKDETASILAYLVKTGIDRMKPDRKGTDEYLLTLTEFLHMLAMKNLLPLHVAFDKRFLSGLIKYFAIKIHVQDFKYEEYVDFDSYVNGLHCVFIEKGVDIRGTIGGLYFSLNYIADKLLAKCDLYPHCKDCLLYFHFIILCSERKVG